MANVKKKISALTAAGAVTIGTDVYAGNQGVNTRKFAALGYIPVQATYPGTMFIGDGGAALSNVGTEAGDFNTYIGIGSGKDTQMAKKNTVIGYHAGNKITSGWANTLIGYNAGAVGVGTGDLLISGTGIEFYANTFVGESAGVATTTGSYNTFIGCNSGTFNLTGIDNCFLGVHAGQQNTSGNANMYIGKSAGYYNNGSYNVGIGSMTLYAALNLSGSVAIGYNSQAANATGAYCTSIGYCSLVYNTNGNNHVAIGYNALFSSNYDAGCVAIGFEAGYLNAVNSNYNTYIGYFAGRTITTGAVSNTFIGSNAGYHGSQLATVDNSTAIGADTYTTAANQAVIGNASVTGVYLGSVSGAAKLFASTARFTAIPTSAAGLSSGDIWSNSNVLTIVP